MPNAWSDLPNGPLLNEILKLASRQANLPDSDYSDFDFVGTKRIKAYEAISALGRDDIRDKWRRRLEVINYYTSQYLLFYCAGLALIAWDEAGELYKLNADQLRLTMKLLLENDRRHKAAVMLLPLKEYLDAKCLG